MLDGERVDFGSLVYKEMSVGKTFNEGDNQSPEICSLHII